MTTTAFQNYRALDQSTNEVRLMRIHGGNHNDDVIKCSLETVALRDANPFYALSYVWGPDEAGGCIMIDGEEVHIRRNLWLFLQSLRDRFCGMAEEGRQRPARRTIRVWADYICIQQSDPDERNYQVSIMGKIYQTADAVYAWLGESQSPHDDGMRCIEEIKGLRAQNRPWNEMLRGQASIDSRLSNIASSAYWSRLWIKQEVLLGKDVWFYFGQDALNWRDLQFATTLKQERHALSRVRRRPAWSSNRATANSGVSVAGSKQAMVSLLNLRALRPGKVSLPELIARFHNAGCQDGRDRLYAVLSLTDIETKQQIAVDYRKPLLQVLLENYHHWTGEEVSSLMTDESGHSNPHYRFFGFCAQMVRMLTFEDLESLRRSETLRQAITVRGVFTTTGAFEILSVCVIGAADRAKIYPLSGIQELGTVSRAFVLQVSMRPPSSHSQHQSEHFIFATAAPSHGDLIARLGRRVFFLRRQNSAGHQVDLFATGMEMSATSVASEDDGRLSTKVLQHPCSWVRRQLQDASFEMAALASSAVDISQSRPEYKEGVNIVCNAAAITMLLAESTMFEHAFSDHAEYDPKDAPDEPLEDGRDKAEFAEILEKGNSIVWSPYAFGIRHGLLMACRVCETTGSSISAQVEEQECECKWDARLTTPV